MNKQNVLEDTLLIEWYEVNKTLFNRKTVGGTPVTVRRDVGQSIKNEELISTVDGMVVRIRIKPCTCMILTTENMATLGSFCFDVGNRHLPVFLIGKSVAVAYDARLYQALKGKYGEEVSLCLETLDPVFVLKAFGNFL
ncbi:urease accessory protein UreE [Sphingobacterium psychroaquaticum]|uniref:hypothetical protein n=1 Tax=Sphingobacterium psychroaquaticum TaxID=561061 RepID=UPI000A1CEB69|nr:hypothetical protein [Sphingobacterium psychroaquaticum]QBQ42661.1 urease accessory protein UreE [Sphingobacterium psychroaquaticum]